MTKRNLRLSESEAERIIKRLRLESTGVGGVNSGNMSAGSLLENKRLKTPLNGLQRWQGLGRLPVGKLNKTEAAYQDELERQRGAGMVLWFKAHAFNVRLADNTFYRADFLVMHADMTLAIHEVKGGYTSEKGQLKLKLCAESLPVFRVLKVSKLAGGWKIEEFSK